MKNSPIIDPSSHDQALLGLSYSPSLQAAVQLVLADPAFQGYPRLRRSSSSGQPDFSKATLLTSFRFTRCTPGPGI